MPKKRPPASDDLDALIASLALDDGKLDATLAELADDRGLDTTLAALAHDDVDLDALTD
jgi:hypothetical protein